MKLDFDSCGDDDEVNMSVSFNTLSYGCDMEDGSEYMEDNQGGSHHAAPESPSSSHPLFSPKKCRPMPKQGESPMPLDSPPYKKIRALRLFDSPATPKTLLQKCANSSAPREAAEPIARPGPRSRLFRNRIASSVTPVATPSPPESEKKVKEVANINPFTPTGMLLSSRKRSRSKRELDINNHRLVMMHC